MLWVDASAGVAGDMLLAALVDLGADLDAVSAAVEAVLPRTVRLTAASVTRAGLRATKVDVELLAPDQPHRSWRDVDALLDAAPASARRVFAALAEAEGRAHGVPAADVHFHEVGAWDSVADVVGVCAALELLGEDELGVGPVALGSGEVRGAHGVLPVPGPAVLELCRGLDVTGGGPGELATPTGVALLAVLGTPVPTLPAVRVDGVGVGAGTRDPAGRANVVRVVRGVRSGQTRGTVSVLETTVDDLDPRVWPTVLEDLLGRGALDAWLTPVLMKKGRPGHVLTVLCDQDRLAALEERVLATTSSLGVRSWTAARRTLDRTWVEVAVPGGTVRVKVGLADGRVVHATPEFEDCAALAAATGRPVREVLAAAAAAPLPTSPA